MNDYVVTYKTGLGDLAVWLVVAPCVESAARCVADSPRVHCDREDIVSVSPLQGWERELWERHSDRPAWLWLHATESGVTL